MHGNLLSTLWPRAQVLHKAVILGLGVLLLTLASKVQVPFWPVPMTLQVLAVLMIGATAGARLGGATVLAWLALGAVGVPVFATGAGLAYMAGPTGGYLAGFLAASLLVGYLADRGLGRGIGSAVLMLLAGLAAIYALGLGWLGSLIGFEKAVAVGLMPFIPAEVLKLALGTAVLTAAWKQAKR
ncbi:biotin transporter BioY [Aestuariivirga sp.]|jgi:biotin transport system substrate-specific component|uniref:biotin transporter BioY n=1 Tax=Aestuariivirga sp. TaxID=2650926 RepID=UPI003784546C